MKEMRLSMGMPVALEIVDAQARREDLELIFAYFDAVDCRFSTYKEDSEISRLNNGVLAEDEISLEMREVFSLGEQTKRETDGYFDMRRPDGRIDPSGIVKGWAIRNAARMLVERGLKDFFINAGGDIASRGKNATGADWSIGIENPFNRAEIVKVVYPQGSGVATSGAYIRGAHIYNPHAPHAPLDDIVSITVIGPDILEADRFATAAFAMGKEGIAFTERVLDLEGYLIDPEGVALMTSGFARFTRV